MAPKIIFGFIIVIAAIIGISQAWFRYEEKNEVLDIRNKVKTAKTRGQRELRLPPPIPYYSNVRDLDDALGNYSTVIAEPISVHTRLSSDSSRIEAWYKFKLIDFLSHPEKPHDCGSCETIKEIPPEVLPVNENEVLIVRYAGKLEVDGVNVRSEDLTFPDYQLNQKYLLFLTLDLNSRIASVELGPQGVSLISTDGELHSIAPNSQKLSQSLKDRYGKVSTLKDALKFRKFSRQQ
ncbi:MAG TPA: hypothetical protein VJP89_17115 [Pyrinomonadaceae bacterium]|nr:hypothetical protein [Pyrinomonadaceae bacterium]